MINLKEKKILITDAHRFVGRHLVRNLLGKRGVPKENLFLHTMEEIDFRKWEDCQKTVTDKDIVIYLAAKVGVSELI